MFFCSHCGLLLNPGTTQCPRCATAVDAEKGAVNVYPDALTTQSAATGTVSQEDYRTAPDIDNRPFVIQNTPPHLADDTPPPPPTQPARPALPPVAGQPFQGYPQTGVPAYDPYTQQPAQPIMSYPTYPTTDHPGPISQVPPPAQRRYTGLVAAIIGFLLVLVMVMAFVIVVGPRRIFRLFDGQSSPAPIVTVTTTQATPSPVPTVAATSTQAATTTATKQAQSVITQYFSAINQKDYQSAYNLWANNPQTYNDFAQGFTHTQRDDVVFDDLAQQQDGTVRVFITLTATADTGAISVYRGYYLVGQQVDGTWKIIAARVNSV